MAEKNVVLRGLVNDNPYDFMPKTNVYNVYVDDDTLLADKLFEVITALNGKVTPSQMSIAIQEALNEFPFSDTIPTVGIESIEIEEVMNDG